MRKLSFLGGLVLFVAVPAMAQDYPRGEVGGGYTYIRVDSGGAGSFNCHGGGGTVAGNLNSWFGVAGEFGGCKVTGLPAGSPSVTAFTYLFGPRVTYRASGGFEPFGEFLFGGARLSGGGSSDNAFAMAIGGGADYKLTSHVAIRLIQADYLYTKFGSTHQNNARIQAGIIFRFGSR